MPLLEWPTQLAAIRGGDTEYETGNSRGHAGFCKRSLPEIQQGKNVGGGNTSAVEAGS